MWTPNNSSPIIIPNKGWLRKWWRKKTRTLVCANCGSALAFGDATRSVIDEVGEVYADYLGWRCPYECCTRPTYVYEAKIVAPGVCRRLCNLVFGGGK